MSKIIKLTPQYVEECIKEFQESLNSGKFTDGKISYNKILSNIQRKAKLLFTDIAWQKMQMLIAFFETEVAWHGVAHRGEDESKDEYYVSDILVYPQEVSGASVEMNVAKYDEWVRRNIEMGDERFFNIAMQGHSHVRMPTSPSGVDLSHQEAILEQLTEDMFYIFVIWNKENGRNIKIYDLTKNVLFETEDVEVEVINDGYGLNTFINEAKKMVEKNCTSKGYKIVVDKNKEKKSNRSVCRSSVREGKKYKGVYNDACETKHKINIPDYDDMEYPYNDPFYYKGY